MNSYEKLPKRVIADQLSFVRKAIAFIIFSLCATGCASRMSVSIEKLKDPPCSLASGISWVGPTTREDRARLSDWCSTVGTVMVKHANVSSVDVATSGLTVVTWNQHAGHGDLKKFLQFFIARSPVVALIQEANRKSDSVPLDAPPGVRVPKKIGSRNAKRDLEAIAYTLNLSVAYVPSMANGLRSGEDRGNAILSTLPISDVMGIELPWVSQRRVAVAATVSSVRNGVPWRIRVISVHLDNRSGRSGEAAAIGDFLIRNRPSDLPIVIGGDFNAWFGIDDPAVQEMDRAAPRIRECGNEGTFRFFSLRLDHLFTTLPLETHGNCFVGGERFDSDHYPLVMQFFKNVFTK